MLITEKDVKNKIRDLENEGYTWKPLGGIFNNEGFIQTLTDPGAGLTERVTNAIDAVLEKYYLRYNWNVKKPDHLANEIKKKIGEKEFKNLINISIYNSQNKDSEKNITTIVTDKGIGISNNEFEDTILKLGGANKLKKKYLMGAYGQGGSTSVKFNEFTIIHSKDKNDKEVMTIIRYNPGTKETKNGFYEYIVKVVNGDSNFASSFVLKERGTKIINVATYYKKQSSKSEYQKIIYNLLTNRLFHPPLPFTLIDRFQNIDNDKKILIEGARNNLIKKIKDKKFFEEKKLKTKEGSKIYIRWWVIMSNEKNFPKNQLNFYLKNSQSPFNFTMNGQTQGYFGNSLLNDAELSFLKKRFVCEVELTNISKNEKKSILSSSRENISESGYFWEEIKKKIINYLNKSKKLQSINKKIREMTTSIFHDDKFFSKELSKNLKKLGSLFSKGKVRSSFEIKKSITKHQIQTIEENLKDFPTYFNFKVLNPHRFSKDKLKIRYKTDGKRSVVLNAIKIIKLPNSLKFISKDQKGQNGFIVFDAKEIPLNKILTITFDILNGTFVKDVNIKKINPSEKPKNLGYPKTKIFFIDKEEDKNYDRLDFNKQKPCEIDYSKETNNLSIYINIATYEFIGNYLISKKNIYNQFRGHYSMGLSIYIITLIKKYEDENKKVKENYDYNPIAKNLIWSFENIRKINKK